MNFDKLIIDNISTIYDAEYIIEVLYKQNIGEVERIILVPYISPHDGEMYTTAYVNMRKWYSGNYARGFIRTLLYQYHNKRDGNVLLYHFNDLHWTVSLTLNTDGAFNLACDKLTVCYYNENYFKTLNWNTDSAWYVNSEYVSRKCVDMILANE